MEKPEGKYAWTVTVGTKGQIVLPKEARRQRKRNGNSSEEPVF